MILGPLAAGGGLFLLKPDFARRVLVVAVTLALLLGALALAWLPSPGGLGVPHQRAIDHWMFLAEIGMGLYAVFIGGKARHAFIIALAVAQTAVIGWFEWAHGAQAEGMHALFVDKFSILLALINGLVGGGICLYALGYMREYHESAHRQFVDRRPLFFGLLFVFVGAMFGIIFSNNLLWLFFFWEVTTLCSFLLIGYTRTEEARRNALRALVMNLAGGLAFAVAIAWSFQATGTIELQQLVTAHRDLVLVPAALLCFAGLTKSAQLPFSSWLLGAMVAPTPVSALLHSSTMVKAGVYLVLRMAPIITGTAVGLLVGVVGSVTFLVGSLAAVTTSESKKVLAYSTVANLGLIVLCGGIGTSAAVWAGLLLILFHAVAKCLLFLCVGVVEHKLRTRDIEAMSGLILRMPRVAVLMLIGMAGMFLAPFGMLISKWAVLKAVVDACPALSVFIVFGSAATLFFWVKWMGKLLEVVRPQPPEAKEFVLDEGIALYGLGAATFLACLLFPVLSSSFIEPYVLSVYGQCVAMSPGNMVLMTIMMVMVMLFPLSFLNYGRGVKVMEAYLGGANLQSSTRFLGTAHQAEAVELSNYYLRDFLDEHKLTSWGTLASSALLVLLLGAAFRPTQNTSPAPLAGAALALPSPHPEPLVQSP